MTLCVLLINFNVFFCYHFNDTTRFCVYVVEMNIYNSVNVK